MNSDEVTNSARKVDRRIRSLKRRLGSGRGIRTFVRISEYQSEIRDQLIAAIQLGDLCVEPNSCPVCGQRDGDVISGTERMGIPLSTAFCRHCPSMYSTVRFTSESMSAFYSSWYRTLSTGRQDPGVNFREMQASAGRVLFAYVMGLGFLKNPLSRILDVGCGAGGTLEPFAQAGFDCVGIDLDANFLSGGSQSRIRLENVRLEDFDSDELFDLIILDDVIEHLPDPSVGLSCVRSLLSDDGIVACQVPVLDTLRELGYRNDLRRYFQIAHVNHFSIAGLSALFAKAGMDLVDFDGIGQFVFRVNCDIKGVTGKDLLESRERILSHLVRVTKLRRFYSIREFVAGRLPLSLRRLGRTK